MEANISEQDFYCDSVLEYIDDKDKYDGIEDELSDLTFSAITTAIVFSSADVVERILSFDDIELSIYDKMLIDRIDWSTVIEADIKKKLIEEKLGYKFSIYNTAIIKNKKCDFVGGQTVTLDSIKKRLNAYDSGILEEEFVDAITYQVNSDFVDTYNLLIKVLFFIVSVEIKPEDAERYKYVLNDYNDKYSMTFVNVANSFIEKEYDLDFIKQQFLPMIEPVFKILMVNRTVNFKSFTQMELISILQDWKSLISTSKNSESLEEIKKLILSVEYDESMFENVEEVETETNGVMFESVSNGIPLEVATIGLSQYRQEYYNAPPRYYSYIGADIVNKNKDCIAEDVRITVTFYQDGMIIDKYEDVIGIIQNDSTFHYGGEFYVDEKYDNYSVRINGCNFAKNLDNIDYSSYFKVNNLKYRVDNIESETKISCTVRSEFPNYIRKVIVYVQFLKNKKIVAGNYLVQYDLEAFGEYDLIDKIDMAIDCDKVVYSVVPIA